MNPPRREYQYDIILFAVAVGLYAPSLWCGFVGDDLIYFVGNKFIESLDLWTILRFGAIGADYLPLRDISFALDYLIWGRNPFGFHLTNLITYGVTVVALRHLFIGFNGLITAEKAENYDMRALVAVMLFTLHPTHRDVVFAIHNRGALLTSLFSILSSIFFLKFLKSSYHRYASYAISITCFVLALMSREYSIILPLVLVLMIFWEERPNRITHLSSTLPFFGASAVFYCVYKQYATAANCIPSSNESFLSEAISRVSVAVKIIAFYMVRMATFAGRFSETDEAIYALSASIIVAVTLAITVACRRSHPHLCFGFLLYLICLIPVLNFYNTEPVVAARYSYLPCMGLFFAYTAIPFSGTKRLMPILCVAFTVWWSVITKEQAGYYRNNIAYWENTSPYERNAFVLLQLGLAYYDGRQYEKASETLRMVEPALHNPRYFEALGNSCLETGNYQCAIQAFKKLMTFDNSRGLASAYLARAYLKLGDRSNAEAYIKPYRDNLHLSN